MPEKYMASQYAFMHQAKNEMRPFPATMLANVMLLPLCWPKECGGVNVLWRSGEWATSALTPK